MSPVAKAILDSWSIPFWATTTLLFTAIIYVRGWRLLSRRMPRRFPRWRLATFLSGVAAVWIAIASPLDALANLLLTAHMMQHLLLMVVAPPLILLGAPAIPLLRGLPRWAARDAVGPFFSWPFLRRIGIRLTHPAFAWTIMAVTTIGWHIPAAYELALRSPQWHEVEHACFFFSWLLFWWPVVMPWPSRPQWPRWTIPLYLLLGSFPNTVLSAFLAFSGRVLYPSYAAVPRLFGLSALDDQVVAGCLMWIAGSLASLGAAVCITVQLLSPSTLYDERPALSSAVRSHPPRPGFDLLRAPLIGRFLRARHGRRILQAVLLLLALAVIADGFFGPTMAPMNLAGVLPWTYARSLAVLALLVAGNFFCMACPFTLPRELGRRLGLATRRWPRPLRSKWLAAGLLAFFFWAYEALGLWNTPFRTALIVVAYFAFAFLVDTFFQGSSFCKYVCPIGQFSMVSSLVSPLEVKVRKQESCADCATHDCIRGNAHQRGCELQLYLPQKSGNMDCTFCLDCVKACPHDNVGILPVNPVRDLIHDGPRSSVGRFARRTDVAALALVVVFSAFASAAAMVAPVIAWRDDLTSQLALRSTMPLTTLFFLIALILIPALALGAAVWAGRLLSSAGKSAAGLFCRFSLALVPLGLAMWGAHVLFHLSTGWSSAWPVFQRAVGDLGIARFGAPQWTMLGSLLAPHALLATQLLMLDAGLLMTLYSGWRIANACMPRLRSALGLLAPWVVLAAALYAAGIWIFLQPMQMRGMVH